MAVGVALAAVAAPASADVPPESLSAYVRARAADADGRADAAAAGYALALAQAPGDPVIAIRAYRQALAAGDDALAVRAASVLVAARAAPADVSVLLFAAALQSKQPDAAVQAADAIAEGPLEFLAPVLKAWLAYDAKQGDPVAMLAADSKSILARRFNAENAALLLIARGKRDEGVAALRTLLITDSGNADLRINAAALLACDGGRDAARALLAGNDPALAAARDRCAKPNAAFGASRLFTRLAREIAGGEARPLAIVLTRAALMLDPSDDRARLTLAEALSRDGASAEALAVLDAAKPGETVATARVEVLQRAGQTKGALAAATSVSLTSDGAQRLGDLLVAAGRYDDAAAAYGTAIARAGEGSGWVLYLQQGGALEQAGKWAEALPLLQKAVALAPDNAVALNYLGYAQVERGENLAAARALIERAAKLRPDDASIIDSLGWAWFRSGDAAKALPLLERAARERPASAVVNDHLGDAYWAVGRRYEARYAWNAAALAATAADATRIADKVANGLPPR